MTIRHFGEDGRPLATDFVAPAGGSRRADRERGPELPTATDQPAIAAGSAFPSAQAIADQASDGAPIVIGLDFGRQPDMTAYSLVRDGRVILVGVDLDETDLARIQEGRLNDLRIRLAGDPE